MEVKVFVLLPVYNRKDITLKFVSLLKQQDYKNFILVLIDDGSQDGTAESVCKELQQTIVLKGKGNWWWGGSLHQGYKWLKKQLLAEDDIVLIINNDTEIKNDFISKGISILNKNKKTLLLASAYDLQTGELVDHGVVYDFKKNSFKSTVRNTQLNCLSTRGLFLRVKDFVALGGFYPKLLPHYLSDYEFTIRAFRNNYNLICDDDLKLWLDNNTTGIHHLSIESQKWSEFWKLYFSKRYAGNPLYAINFYLLAFPFPYNLKHTFIQLKQSVKTFISVIRQNLKQA